MRRDIGRHADGNSIRPIDDQIGKARRQHGGLGRAFVVIGNEVNRVLIDVGQHLAGNAGHAALGVAHGRGRVAVYGAEVALAINHGIAHAEGLRQPHHGVVDGRVAVRVIHAHGLTDHLGALGVLLVEFEPHAMQGVKNSAMHRLEAVSNVGERTANDDRHGVVEIRTLHLIFNVDRDEASSWAFRRVAVAAVGT